MDLSSQYSTDAFEARFTYKGQDLGANWHPEYTDFRVWAPGAEAVWVLIYRSGAKNADDCIGRISMTAGPQGTWTARLEGDLNGVYYTYRIRRGNHTAEACDPYARAAGVNGDRAMVIDLSATDPAGWAEDRDPNAGLNITDVILYEQHIRDASIQTDSPNAGKYAALAEDPSLSHMKQLGITHVHILPMYDYATVDEAAPHVPQFNWGYDPKNFNVPEGSYSSDPHNGAVRVREVKQMIQKLHQNGISVVMDVVYNHVYSGKDFCFNRIVPGYFSRIDENGIWSNGSCCGNDTASERSMVRKYIVDSVKYWAEEYHIDGFRFDLVGLLDTQTVNDIMTNVKKDHPNVIFYGEGWTMNTRPTKSNVSLAVQGNSHLVPGFAFFSDTFRDMLKGSVLEEGSRGYVTGVQGLAQLAADAWRAKTHWCSTPSQMVQYNSCHDNMTLFDKICSTTPGQTREVRIRRHLLAAAMTLTAQGIPLLHAGEELLRSKNFEDNSYKSSDAVNAIRWEHREDPGVQKVLSYYQGLIALRKDNPAFRLSSPEAVNTCVQRLPAEGRDAIAFRLFQEKGDLCIVFNPDSTPATLSLPEGSWEILVWDDRAGTTGLGNASGQISIPPIRCAVFRRSLAVES